jgi:hypothetical protein
MRRIKATSIKDVPGNYTGIIEWSNGDKNWWQNSLPHRIDGPAFEWQRGEAQYWVRGSHLTKEQFNIFQFLWENTTEEKTIETTEALVRLSKASPVL